MSDKDLLDPQNNELIPRDSSPWPITTMTMEQIEEGLDSREGYPSDLGDGLTVDRPPLKKTGLRVYKDGIIVRDLTSLTEAELQRVRKFLRGTVNDLIPPE